MGEDLQGFYTMLICKDFIPVYYLRQVRLSLSGREQSNRKNGLICVKQLQCRFNMRGSTNDSGGYTTRKGA